jgi:hypothetical protein
MIERVKRLRKKPEGTAKRVTVLDDRLLHMTREEARAYLDAYIQERDLIGGNSATANGPQDAKRPRRRPPVRRAQA